MDRTVHIKNAQEIALMREAGQRLAQVFDMLDEFVIPGRSTMEINHRVEEFIVRTLGARPASKGQYGYPYAINSSVNEVACHGVPHPDQILSETDIINLDVTLEHGGFIVDCSKNYLMPSAGVAARALVSASQQALWAGIRQVRPGAMLGDIGYTIQRFAESHGYSVVREYCGHGIGREMHEAPQVLHYGLPNRGLTLREGMVFTIEPILNLGSDKVYTRQDGWSVATSDNQLSAQSEHTVLVTANGYEVLTAQRPTSSPTAERHS